MDRRGHIRMVVGMRNQCLSVSSNPAHGEVYSVDHNVIKFVSDLRQVGGFLPVLLCPPLIAERLLKAALNNINLTYYFKCAFYMEFCDIFHY